MRAEDCKAGSIARPLELLATSVVQQREALLISSGLKRSFMVFNIRPWFFQNSFQKTTNKRNSLSFDRMSIRSQRAKIRSRVERRGVSSGEHSPILWGRPVSSLSDTCFHFLLLSPHSCSWTVAEVRDELILIFKNIFYFIVCFGCAGSPLLPGLFSSCGE